MVQRINTLFRVFAVASCAMMLTAFAVVEFDCNYFNTKESMADQGINRLKHYLEHEDDIVQFDQECLHLAINKNYYDSTELMINEYFSKDPKRLAQAESTVRNAIEQVRSRQNTILDSFDGIRSNDIPVISPAFRWAQGVNNTFLEIKWATRFDSPACLDIFDTDHKVLSAPGVEEGSKKSFLVVSAMCRNDKKLLKYEMKLELYGEVEPVQESQETPGSYFETQSVGRLYVSLLKKEPESRWRKLLAEGQVKPSNMNTWWEMSEKHEKELDDLAPLDDDDEAKNDGFVDVNKKVKSKKDKRSKGKKKNTPETSQTAKSSATDSPTTKEQPKKSSEGTASSWYNPMAWF